MDVYAEPVEPPAPKKPRPQWARTFALGLVAGCATWTVLVAGIPADLDPAGTRVQAALSLYASGDRLAASAACAALIEELPEEPRGWLVAGLLAEDADDLAGAEKAYRRSWELSPGDPERRRELEVSFAELARRRGDPAEGLRLLDGLADGPGDPVRRKHARALCLLDLGRFDDALNEARAIAEIPHGSGVAQRVDRMVQARREKPESRDG